MDYTAHGILLARILELYPVPSPGNPPNPGIEPGPPALQVDSLPVELPGNPPSFPAKTIVDILISDKANFVTGGLSGLMEDDE